jgi:hypothetical protein
MRTRRWVVPTLILHVLARNGFATILRLVLDPTLNGLNDRYGVILPCVAIRS